MKRLILALALAVGCATTGATSPPPQACLSAVTDTTVKDAARRALDIIVSGASKETIVANLEGLARDVGPEAFDCAMEYLRARL